MSEQALVRYKDAKVTREDAEAWNKLPEGPKYQNDKFNISIAHCKSPMLCRAGQKRHGANNYWETDKRFNQAILEHIVDNWNKIFPDVINRLKAKEEGALRDCQDFVNKIQNAIDAAS